jgi:sortase A
MAEKQVEKQSGSRLRRFNNFLSVIAIILSLYIIIFPVWPQFTYWWRSHFGHKPALVVANTPSNKSDNKPPEVIPKDNTLVIPRLSMQETIFDGPTAATLNKGVWRRPQTSTPDRGSNTVLVGHRFTYTDPEAVFYHLDKVQTGDDIIVYWQQKKYVYKVDKILIVPPTDIEIENPTNEPLLTVYTCTPLWTAKNRLIIQAKPVEVKS